MKGTQLEALLKERLTQITDTKKMIDAKSVLEIVNKETPTYLKVIPYVDSQGGAIIPVYKDIEIEKITKIMQVSEEDFDNKYYLNFVNGNESFIGETLSWDIYDTLNNLEDIIAEVSMIRKTKPNTVSPAQIYNGLNDNIHKIGLDKYISYLCKYLSLPSYNIGNFIAKVNNFVHPNTIFLNASCRHNIAVLKQIQNTLSVYTENIIEKSNSSIPLYTMQGDMEIPVEDNVIEYQHNPKNSFLSESCEDLNEKLKAEITEPLFETNNNIMTLKIQNNSIKGVSLKLFLDLHEQVNNDRITLKKSPKFSIVEPIKFSQELLINSLLLSTLDNTSKIKFLKLFQNLPNKFKEILDGGYLNHSYTIAYEIEMLNNCFIYDCITVSVLLEEAFPEFSFYYNPTTMYLIIEVK